MKDGQRLRVLCDPSRRRQRMSRLLRLSDQLGAGVVEDGYRAGCGLGESAVRCDTSSRLDGKDVGRQLPLSQTDADDESFGVVDVDPLPRKNSPFQRWTPMLRSIRAVRGSVDLRFSGRRHAGECPQVAQSSEVQGLALMDQLFVLSTWLGWKCGLGSRDMLETLEMVELAMQAGTQDPCLQLEASHTSEVAHSWSSEARVAMAYRTRIRSQDVGEEQHQLLVASVAAYCWDHAQQRIGTGSVDGTDEPALDSVESAGAVEVAAAG